MKVLLALAFLKLASCTINHGNYLPPGNRGYSGGSSFSGASSFSGGSSFSGVHSGGYSGASSYSGSGQQIPIVRLDAQNEGDGSYQYNYETGNGISAQEQGEARGDGTKAHGGFSYTAPDGQQIRITYVADENGFRPEGSHIPTPPPIPDAILKSIQQNLADEARGVSDDGSYRDNQGGGGGGSGHYGGSSFGRGGGGGGGYQY